MTDIAKKIKSAGVVPVAVFNRKDDALAVAGLLMENGLPLVEVTLRTEAAYECIEAMASMYPDMLVGAGSVLSPEAMKKAADRGARFGVAPCNDPEVYRAARSMGVPFVPGVATPTELNNALRMGAGLIKIFPASDLGGVGYINALCAPFKMEEFGLIPTGGINEKNIASYYASPRVIACGLSYIVDTALAEKGDLKTLAERIRTVQSIIPR